MGETGGNVNQSTRRGDQDYQTEHEIVSMSQKKKQLAKVKEDILIDKDINNTSIATDTVNF